MLVHASLQSLVQKTAQARQHMSGLPLLGRILLQTGPKSGHKYQTAVASALAHKLQVRMTVPHASGSSSCIPLLLLMHACRIGC